MGQCHWSHDNKEIRRSISGPCRSIKFHVLPRRQLLPLSDFPTLLSWTRTTPYIFGKMQNLLYPMSGNLGGGLLSKFSNLTSRTFDPPTDEIAELLNTCDDEASCADANQQNNGRSVPTWGVSYLVSRTSFAPKVRKHSLRSGVSGWISTLKSQNFLRIRRLSASRSASRLGI